MRPRISFCVGLFWAFSCMGFAVQAQDLGPGFTKVKDGIYVFSPARGHCDLQLRRYGGRRGDDRQLPQPVGFPSKC